MDDPAADDTNLLAKRKLDNLDVEENGSIIKRSKATQQTQLPPFEELDEDDSQYNLMHFSDDVMLYILHYCSPRELKALSFCCQRLARLCMDRSLWRMVELRQQALGVRALTFYTHCLKSSTTSLYIRGLIGSGCTKSDNTKASKNSPPGPTDCSCINSDDGGNTSKNLPIRSEDMSDSNSASNQHENESHNIHSEQGTSGTSNRTANDNSMLSNSSNNLSNCASTENKTFRNVDINNDRPGPSTLSSNQTVKESGNTSPKPFSAAYKEYLNHSDDAKADVKKESPINNKPEDVADCCKYRTHCLASITKNMMTEIRHKCINLRDLRLEYCNLNCNSFPISYFPKTLKKLSLKGCRRASHPFQKQYLFKIQDYLPELEELDLSYCRWLSGHSLLLLSKMSHLKKLWLRGCVGLGECVAYASLSTRFGFKALEFLDVRGTSMGDSEVSSFSFLANLKQLYLEPPFSDIDIDSPNGWPEHSGLMEPWESEYPSNEVDEYIDIMNKDEILSSNATDADCTENVKSSKANTEMKNSSDVNNSSAENRRNDNGDEMFRNPGFYYSSLRELYERQIPMNRQNADANRQNNDRPPPAPPRRPVNQANVENGGLQLGAVVGAIRCHLRAQRGDRAQQENGAQPEVNGVQVGPVEVQVGPQGVQVGLGRVNPGWENEVPDAREMELGDVRVDPRWMQIAPGVHVGFQEVEVQLGQDGQPNQGERNEEQILQVGPIDIQVRQVGFQRMDYQIGGDARAIRYIRPNVGRNRNPENNAPQAPVNQPELERNMNDNQYNADNRQDLNNPRMQQDVQLNIPLNRIWYEAFHDDPEHGFQIGFNVRRRGVDNRRNRRQNEGVQPQHPQQNQANNEQVLPDQRNPNDNNEQINNVQREDEPANNGEQAEQRNARQNPARPHCRHRNFVNMVRIGNHNHDRLLLNRVLRRHFLPNPMEPEGADRHAQNGQNDGQQNNDELGEQNRQAEPNEQPLANAPVQAPEILRQVGLEANPHPEAQARQDNQVRPDELARPERPARPCAFMRLNEHPRLNEPGGPVQQPRADAHAPINAHDRPEGHPPRAEGRPPRADRHNIIDGRVHVIYVNPQYPRRLAADVLVAAGMPRNLGMHRNAGLVMLNEGANAFNREEFELRNVQHVLDVQFPLLAHLQHLGGGDLVTDASLLHFGDSEHLIRVGGSQNGRQRYSPLEVLVCRGYRGVTDQSLAHLATAAPALRHLDMSGCGITSAGTAEFTMHRPDCKLYNESNESTNREPQQN